MAKVRPNISSASLFHFLDKKEYLIDIIKNGFQARYTYEVIPKVNVPIAIPMKCFCDIPLGLIKKHLTLYGNYGIGISKEFAMENEITPLIYVHDNSSVLKIYLNDIMNSKKDEDLATIIAYFKNYKGIQFRNGKRIKSTFYDEREWRYIPNDYDAKPLNKIKGEDERRAYVKGINDKLPKNKYRLKIPIADIRYIFIQNEIDIPDVIKTLKDSKWLSEKDFNILLTKIITSDQIINDF